MARMKELDLQVSEIVLELAEMPIFGIEHLGAVLAERKPGTAKMLLAALQLNFERLEKGIQNA